MKKPIFYAVIRERGFAAKGYFEILTVTTERGRQLYGRDDQEASTHVAARDCLKRCDTREEADAVLVAAENIRTRHRKNISEARRALTLAESAERRELDELVRAK